MKKKKPKPRHSLSAIDSESMIAICTVCGPTKIYKASSGKKQAAYMCSTRSNQRSAAYRLKHPYIPRPQQFRPTAHLLSNVDDENRTATCSRCGLVKIYVWRSNTLIYRVCKNAANRRSKVAEKKRRAENREFAESYKLARGCKNCGYREDSKVLQFHTSRNDRRPAPISRLMRLRQERLLQELEKLEVVCKNCYDKAHPKPLSKSRRKHKPLPFMLHTK